MSLLSSLSLTPSLPACTGPYSVGTQELEFPVSELSSSPQPPDPSLSTISCRMFYPCESDQNKIIKPVYWLPEPQSEFFAAYARFMRASPWLASLLSCLPIFHPLFHTTIGACPSAPLLPPRVTADGPGRWPVLIFSHGLGGFKNTYSFLLTSLASHGLVVIALEHRDGSAPVSFVRQTAGTYQGATKVESRRLGHSGGAEVDEKRDQQLKIRCWEMGGVFDALTKLEQGKRITNLAPPKSDASGRAVNGLEIFEGKLDILSPGRVVWGGHSFGAATVVQFVKSVFYKDQTLFAAPDSSSALRQQITPASPTILLDLWAQPLHSMYTLGLWEKPLPCYWPELSNTSTNPSVSASAPLAILSESFFKWESNLADTIRVVSPPLSPSKNPPLQTPTIGNSNSNATAPSPHIFYPLQSAHLSQSDFGLLFPWFTKRVFKAEEPLRTIVLNTRAILETLRRAGLTIADTSKRDMEASGEDRDLAGGRGERGEGEGEGEGKVKAKFSDSAILDTEEGAVRGWLAIPFALSDSNAALGVGMMGDRLVKVGVATEKGGAAAKEIDTVTAGSDSGYDSPVKTVSRE